MDSNSNSKEDNDYMNDDLYDSEFSSDSVQSDDSDLSLQRRLMEEKREESFDTYETWLSHIWSTEDLFDKYRRQEEQLNKP